MNAGFHVSPKGCGLINGLTILLAMPSRLIEVLCEYSCKFVGCCSRASAIFGEKGALLGR